MQIQEQATAFALTSCTHLPFSRELITEYSSGSYVRHLRFRVQPICGKKLERPQHCPSTWLSPSLFCVLPSRREGVTFRIQLQKPNLIELGESA